MNKSYSFCIIVPSKGNLTGLTKSIESILNSERFEETLVILAFESKRPELYELPKDLFALLDGQTQENICWLENICNVGAIEQIKTEITGCGCEEVFLLEEGDTMDPHLMSYMGYFFEDEQNRVRCSTVFVPVCDPDQREIPEEFKQIPADGVCSMDEESLLVDTLKGAVFHVDVFNEEASHPELDLTAFYGMALGDIVRKGHYGALNTACYYSKSKGTQGFGKLLSHMASFAKESKDRIPTGLQGWINHYLEKQMEIAAEERDGSMQLLLPYASLPDEEIETVPAVEITEIQNYYSEAEIVGFVRLGNADGVFSISADTEITLQETEDASCCLDDLLHPRIQLTLRVKLDENKANVRFLENGTEITYVSVTEPIRNYEGIFRDGAFSVEKIAPRAFYMVSVVIPVFNGEKYLREAVDSVTSQSLDFFPNTQIVLVDDGSTDGTGTICREFTEKYPYNVTFVSLEHNRGVSAARNVGLRRAMGKYVMFLDADDKLEQDLLKTGVAYLEKQEEVDVAAFPIQYFGGVYGEGIPAPSHRFGETAIIDIEEKPNYVQFSACGVLMRKSSIDGIEFDESMHFSEDAEFMHRVILQKMKYAVMKEPFYLYRRDDSNDSAMSNRMQSSDWRENYGVFGKKIAGFSLEQYDMVTKYTQYLIVHELIGGITPANVELDLADTEFNGIMESIGQSLQTVEDELIASAETVPYWFRMYLIKLKYGFEITVDTEETGEPMLCIGGYTEKFVPELWIDALREREGVLRIFGHFDLPFYDGISPQVICGDRGFEIDSGEGGRRDIYFLGRRVHESKTFELEIPCTEDDLQFLVNIERENFPVRLRFGKNTALNGGSDSFFAGQNLLVMKGEENQLCFEPLSPEKIIEKFKKLLKDVKGKEKDEANSLMESYIRMQPFLAKSRIWLFVDKPHMAGASAQLYRFCMSQKDGIDKYYISGKDSIPGYELSQEGASVVDYGSEMHKLLYLFAEKIIVSQLDEETYNPFAKSALRPFVPSFVNSTLMWLPEDILTEHDVKKLSAFNVPPLLSLSSKRELEVLPKTARRAAQTCGLPKYDSLKDTGERKILFMPTWRKFLYLGEHTFNFEFNKSEYCQKISEFLCDERLMDAVEEYGYEFCFAPDEKVYLEISEFEMDAIVDIIPPKKSRTKLAESCALLVTDYLPGFDFAYLKKPVLYYHFAEQEEIPDEALISQQFGEEVSDHERLVDLLIEYMGNECQVPEQYQQQANEFFVHMDQSNCERIYSMLR